MKIVSGPLSAESGKIFDFKISGFFQVVVVSDDVGFLLALDLRWENSKANEQGSGGTK
jgi:hypothetical protein